MSEADKMFEKLGYEKMENRYIANSCIYSKTIKHLTYTRYLKIIFHYETKKITIDIDYASVKDLQAINKKCFELGWLDE